MARQSSNDNDQASPKDPDLYGSFRDQGYSKEKSARVSNALANPAKAPAKKGGKSPPYEDWTRDQLDDRAAEIGIEGRSDMSKDELIAALRNH